jgi:hypothetical protein
VIQEVSEFSDGYVKLAPLLVVWMSFLRKQYILLKEEGWKVILKSSSV